MRRQAKVAKKKAVDAAQGKPDELLAKAVPLIQQFNLAEQEVGCIV